MTDSNYSAQRENMRMDILLAIEKLLSKDAYKDIGINDICAAAHISKPTFYRYFQGKDYVVHWLTDEIFKCGVAEVGRKYTWYEGISNTVAAFYRYSLFYSNTKSLAFSISIISNSSVFLRNILIETIIEYKKAELTEKLVYQIDALNYSFGHIIKQWCDEGTRVLPQKIAEYLTSVVPSDLFKLLNEPTQNPDVSD